jgi:hypothetical protein
MSLGTSRNARVRCAIYTRKSSEEGLDQEFNSLLAQREACEAFITSQRHEGCADPAMRLTSSTVSVQIAHPPLNISIFRL